MVRRLGLAIVVATATAAADPAPPAPPHEPCAEDVAGAPVPGTESGRVDAADDGDGTLRQIGRGVLFAPRLVAAVALTPFRASVWAYDRYRLDDLYRRVFFNDALTIGLYPTLSYESGFGLTYGARLVDRDVFGHREHFALEGGFGGRFRGVVGGSVRTGELLGDRLAFDLDAGFERRPGDIYVGIGNSDTMPEGRYRQQRTRAALIGDVRPVDGLHLRPSGEITELSFGPGENGTPIDMAYDPATLVGYGGVRLLYGELELRWDRRTHLAAMEPGATFSSGWLAAAYAGRAHRLDAGADFWRYGVDLQYFLRVGEGPRVIATRFHGEAVSGSTDEVPFTELPKLGGNVFMRGYGLDRFRDRVAAVASTEYQWDLSQLFAASIFIDAGRVFPSLRDASVDNLRVGYGVALEGHSPNSFLVQGSLASSIDGGLFLTLSFNPVFALEERVRRR